MSVGAGPVRFGGTWALLGWLLVRSLVGLARLSLWAVCRPRASLAACGALWAVLHPLTALLLLVLAVHVLDVWQLLDPASWRRRGRPVLLGGVRRLFVYRRDWQPAMTVTGLTQPGPNGTTRLPRLGRVRSLEVVDVVEVRGLLGQRFGAWEDAGPMLAHVFGARDVRVHRGDDRRLTLELVRARRGRRWLHGTLELEPLP